MVLIILAVVIVLLCFLLGAMLVGFFIRKDTAKEGRRYIASDVASFFDRYGLTLVARFFRAYSVGDYSDMVVATKEASTIIKDEDTRKLMLRKVWTNVTREFFQEEAERELMLKEIALQLKAYDVDLAALLAEGTEPAKVTSKK